ncbi:MAG: putative baseplate assembly protein [Oscillochloris sp.]|nr:putative baseplate assembly protein [Oscillochloris sp.]
MNNVYAATPQIESILTNTVRATAALTVRDEAVGSSDGTPNQVLTLRHSPVLAAPALLLEVDEGSGPLEWQAVSDFFGSGPHDPHYVLNRATGQISFGDGRRGRIPLAGQFNIIARTYRYGGGAMGNVGAGTITDLTTPIAEVDAVTNFRRVENGKDEESLAETQLRGPRDLLKTRNRAVTLEDFEHLARETPDALVARARAYISLDASTAHMINVVLVPQSSDPKPVPSEVTRRLVCRYLDERRLITTRLRVLGPLYHDIDVDIDLIVIDDADLKTVKNAVDQRLTDYFHPLRGGRDRQGWPFGRAIYYSELLYEIMKIPGVLRVETLSVKKFLPRPAGASNPDDLRYFENEAQANANRTNLLNAETTAFPTTCAVTATVIPVVAPPLQWYVAAGYTCCDIPAAEGALFALRQLKTAVRYTR